jgi:hypothetical protein
VIARFERWLDFVFFAGAEVSVLSLPATVPLTAVRHPSVTARSTLTALVVCAAAVGTLRSRRAGRTRRAEREAWSRPGELRTIAFRSAYYTAVVGLCAFLGTGAQFLLGAWWIGVVGPAALSISLLALFPRVHALFYRLSTWTLDSRG